jgi:hypothetical protein
VPPDPTAKLSELLGNLEFTREDKTAAEKWLQNEVKRRRHKKLS